MCVVCAVFVVDEDHEDFSFDVFTASGKRSFAEYAKAYRCSERDVLAIVHNSHGRVFHRKVSRSVLCKKDKYHQVAEHATIDTVPAKGMRFMLPPSAATKAYMRNKIARITYEV